MPRSGPRILILRSGHTDPEVISAFGDYDSWFTGAMEGLGCRFSVHHVPEEGMPATAGFDGVLVTGTAASVRDNADWMRPLAGFLGDRTTSGPPVLAVCFGAQLAALALGGRVERNPRGWEIGTVEVELTHAGRDDRLFEGLPPRPRLQATHEDHVAELPAGAVRLAGNERTPVQAFAMDRRLRAVQFHPEASAGIIARLIGLRRPVLEADALLQGADGPEAARRSVARIEDALAETDHGRRLLANWVAAWVRGDG